MADKKPIDKLKEGVSIQELENFGKRHRFELFFLGYFILATFFAYLFFGYAWSIFLAGLGGVVGVWIPKKIEKVALGTFRFIFKQEKVTRIILAIVGIILSIFLPPLIFLILGLMGGFGIHNQASKIEPQNKGTPPNEHPHHPEGQ